MNCLVTGATGFLGRHVLQNLSAAGHDVTALVRQTTDASHACIVGDLEQPLSFSGRSFDVVFHLAGKAHTIPRNESERRVFYRANELGTKHLLDALATCKQLPQSIVLISTVAVYGLQYGEMVPESTEPRPTSFYGQSKFAAEILVKRWCSQYGCRWSIVRLPLVAGPGAPGNLRAMVRGLRTGRYFGVGKGDARRSMVRASDVAGVLPRIAAEGGLYHLTDGHHPRLVELEEALCGALKRDLPLRVPQHIARLAAWSGDAIQRCTGMRMPFDSDCFAKLTQSLTVSDSLARQRLGWSPSRVVDHAEELLA